MEVGVKVRNLFADGSSARERVLAKVDDRTLLALVNGICGSLGGEIGLAPRIFLKKLIGELLDRAELNGDFDPAVHYKPVIRGSELSEDERAGCGLDSLDQIQLKW
jgi:hypothetical protein